MTEKNDRKKGRERSPEDSPRLMPPDASENPEPGPSRRLLLVSVCGLLLLLAAALVLLLPLLPDEPNEITQQAPQTPPTIQTTEREKSPVLEEPAIKEVDRLMGVWLRKQAAAEADNVAAWGGDDYTRAVDLAHECDQLLGEQQLLAAQKSCQDAIVTLDDLMASKDSLLDAAQQQGLQALAAGDSERAISHFERVLAIDAEHQQALSGLSRAANIPEVLRLIDAGLFSESAGDVDAALQDYTAAVALDPDFAPAGEHLARIQAAIAEQQFQQSMSAALEALSRGRYSAASAALRQAGRLKPGDPAVLDLQGQLAQTRRAGQLDRLRRDAESFEKKERWAEALSACEQALGIDSQAAFAASCKERVTQRLAIDQRLQAALDRPERLFEDAPLREARQLLSQASELTPRGPSLSDQLDRLAQLIREADTEVEVVLQSDGLTEVVIYHVGRLGHFQEKRLVLRTGNYTATGSRNGFRDIRRTLEVRPGSGPLTFTLRCEEPI
jgi:tetratricopeptide (TPR) repeat protein